MTVYTVSSTDALTSEPLSTLVVGTYTTRGKALDECVAYIMERIERRQDLAWSMLDDKNHPEAGKFFVAHKDGTVGVRKGYVNKLKAFIRDELGGTGCYYVYDGIDRSWHFDVDENGVEGELWHTVTWGDSDCEDPEFTTPWPEAFTSEETAVKTFLDYVDDLVRERSGGDFGLAEDARQRIRKELEDNGRSQFNLSDGCCVSCVLYHSDAINIKA